MLRRGKKEQEQPIPDEVKQSIRRALRTQDGKVLLDFLKARGGVEIPTYSVGKEHEAMIHHGARKALVNELIQILEA